MGELSVLTVWFVVPVAEIVVPVAENAHLEAANFTRHVD